MCCCTKHPNIGSKAETRQNQQCVADTLDTADQALNYQSRYKPEVSYNMDVYPPAPFMHRDEFGQDTLQKSEYWQSRARQEIPDFRKNEGYVRRPDVIIVKDPSHPPYQDNIDRVVEMKFMKDILTRKQEIDYAVIAGGGKN